MTDEIKERPDKPGIWQSDIETALFEFLRSGSWRYYGSKTEYWGERTRLPTATRWRQIVDADGKQVCDPDEPWPPKTRKEKRRVVQYRVDDGERVSYLKESNSYRYKCCHVISDEIRTCEVDESGKVIRVVPVKEEE